MHLTPYGAALFRWTIIDSPIESNPVGNTSVRSLFSNGHLRMCIVFDLLTSVFPDGVWQKLNQVELPPFFSAGAVYVGTPTVVVSSQWNEWGAAWTQLMADEWDRTEPRFTCSFSMRLDLIWLRITEGFIVWKLTWKYYLTSKYYLFQIVTHKGFKSTPLEKIKSHTRNVGSSWI